MTKSIWKFILRNTDLRQSIEMPIGARIISLQTQNELPCIWAIVEVNAEKEVREFEVYGTGHPFYENAEYGRQHEFVGTYQIMNGTLVFHVFELVKIQPIGGL